MYYFRLRPAQRSSLAHDYASTVNGQAVAALVPIGQGEGLTAVRANGNGLLLLGVVGSGYVAEFGSGSIKIPFFKYGEGLVVPTGAGVASVVSAHGFGAASTFGDGAVVIPIRASGQDDCVAGQASFGAAVRASGVGQVAVVALGTLPIRFAADGAGKASICGSGHTQVKIVGSGAAIQGASGVGLANRFVVGSGKAYRGSVLAGAVAIRIRGSGVGSLGNAAVGNALLSLHGTATGDTHITPRGVGLIIIPFAGIGRGEMVKAIDDAHRLYVIRRTPRVFIRDAA